MRKHYSLGPSGAPAWSVCAAKPTREAGLPDERSADASWGTVAHDLAERVLTGRLRSTNTGRARVDETGEVAYAGPFDETFPVEVDAEMLDCVETYVGVVNGLPGEKYIESRVPIDHITGEPEGSGTADCVAIQWDARHMHVADLKGGVGVKVDAYDVDATTGAVRPNLQLALYAEGALRKHDPQRLIEEITLLIVQPRLQHTSEYRLARAELDLWMDYLRARAEATRAPNPAAVPGEKQCRFCRAKPTCPELQAVVFAAALSDFDAAEAREVTALTASAALEVVPLVETWCKAVRAQVFADLRAGLPDPRWKLVEGRRGHRAWTDARAAEIALIAALDHDEMFSRRLITPTQAAAALKRDPETWAVVADLVKQPRGAPSVAPITDRRPAIEVGSAADVFTDLTAEEE